MNGNDMLLCFADIGGEKTEAARNTAALRQSFQKEKRRKTKTAAIMISCAALVIAAAVFAGQNRFGKTPVVSVTETGAQNVMPAQTQHDLLTQQDAASAVYEVDPPPTQPMVTTEAAAVPVDVEPATAVEGEETAFYMSYVYRIADGAYADYTPGRVISAERIGEKLCDALVTGGWQYAGGDMPETEELRCEVYRITGVDPSVAVCIRFLDKSDALTTDHYYVQYNPAADQNTLISDYIIVTEPPREGEE
jgi:hypothetical protein